MQQSQVQRMSTSQAGPYLELLQLLLVCCDGHHQPVALLLEFRALLPHHLRQQLVLKALSNTQQHNSKMFRPQLCPCHRRVDQHN